MALTPKQQRFVAEYLKDSNATQAAIRAGYSAKTAGSQGHDLLKKPEIAAAVQVHLQKVGVTSEVVLGELLRIARADMADAFRKNGALKPLSEMPEDVRRALAGIDVEDATKAHAAITKVRFWDKNRALELLGRHLKLFDDKTPQAPTTVVIVNPYAEPPKKE